MRRRIQQSGHIVQTPIDGRQLEVHTGQCQWLILCRNIHFSKPEGTHLDGEGVATFSYWQSRPRAEQNVQTGLWPPHLVRRERQVLQAITASFLRVDAARREPVLCPTGKSLETGSGLCISGQERRLRGDGLKVLGKADSGGS
jgi:hypothetical protein